MSLCERECLRLAKSHSFRYFEDSVVSTNCTVTESLRLRWASVLFFKGQTSLIVSRNDITHYANFAESLLSHVEAVDAQLDRLDASFD